MTYTVEGITTFDGYLKVTVAAKPYVYTPTIKINTTKYTNISNFTITVVTNKAPIVKNQTIVTNVQKYNYVIKG